MWLAPLGSWPGAVVLAALGAAAGAAISLSARRLDTVSFPYAVWAPLALLVTVPSLVAPDVNPLRSTVFLLGALLLTLLLYFSPPLSTDTAAGLPERAAASPRFPEFVLYAAAFSLLFLIYLRTLAPAVGEADTFEFQVGIARLGIAHGSGYPLLMLLGRLFTLLPIGGALAFRANLTSAFFAALAAAGVQRLARRLGASPIIALLAAFVFGLSPTLWSRATSIEAYSLNACFVASILNLAVDLAHFGNPEPGSEAGRPYSRFPLQSGYLLVFLFGLSLTNHLTTLLLAPACLAAVIWATLISPAVGGSRPARSNLAANLRQIPVVLLCLLLGLSVYLYLPLRWPAVNHGELLSLGRFVNIVSGGEAKGAFDWRLPFRDAGRYAIVFNKIVLEYGWAGGPGLAGLGVVRLARRPGLASAVGRLAAARFGPLVVIALAYLGYLYFALAFNVPDPDFSAFLIPLHLMAAVLMAIAIQWLIKIAQGWRTGAGACLLVAGFGLLPVNSLWQNWPRVDQSQDWAGQRLGELMLGQPLASGAAILADSQKIAPLVYLQVAEGQRPDLDIIVLPDEASYRAALEERLATGQTVYLGRYLPGLGSAYSLRSIGPLAEVSPVPFKPAGLNLQAPTRPGDFAGIHLAGYAQFGQLTTLIAAAGGEMDLTLAWQAPAPAAEDLSVYLRLVDAAGQSVWQSEGSVPVGGLYPTNAWRAGEIVLDFHRIPIDESLPPGNYELEVGLFPPFSAANSGWAAVAPVSIHANQSAPIPPHLLRARLGSSWLVGYAAPESVAPGSRYSITLFWQPGPGVQEITALGETHSVQAWPPGQNVPLRYTLTAPLEGGEIDLQIATGDAARCGWLAPETEGCALAPIYLASQATSKDAYNFDGQLLLTQAVLKTTRAAPGESVSVELEWQALQTMSEDYTVFVHLLGPDGLVHGQIDAWPVSGTRATSSWVPGENISDPYSVPLSADAPTGKYTLEIGLYLLATGGRLPVLNAAGDPIADHIALPGLQVTSSP